MQRWEYMSDVQPPEIAKSMANFHGNEGWEMVSTNICPPGDMLMTFKRPLPEPTPTPGPSAWTNTRPTQGGCYFYRTSPSYGWHIVLVELNDAYLQGCFVAGGRFRIDETPADAEWQGPLTPKP